MCEIGDAIGIEPELLGPVDIQLSAPPARTHALRIRSAAASRKRSLPS